MKEKVLGMSYLCQEIPKVTVETQWRDDVKIVMTQVMTQLKQCRSIGLLATQVKSI